MKNAKVENRKVDRKEQPHRAAGMPVRSGVKAGRMHDFGSGHGYNPSGRDPGGIFE